MYLKRLEIQGFKSFANKTVLDFLPPKDGLNSITGIVGPNGSGKSNVTDAIRWVMGEQAMKNVRAKKNEDVIFNGSATKGAMGAAEVTMVLDNTGSVSAGVGVIHELPLQDIGDFPEITITRRLYRSGESEYVVNNNPARLLDIHLLLAKAKFAEHAYSIVSQGMIDRLLTVSPSERKDFFDEACGIKEHQIKQHQASLKLARTEENLKQADTLLAEVAPRLKLLAKQVKKLEKRQEVETELTAAQEQYYFTIYSSHQAEMDALKTNLRQVEENYRAAFGALEGVQSELAELARASTRQEVFDALQTRHQEAVKAMNELERKLAIIEGQLQTSYSQAGAQNIGWLEGKITELNSTEASLQNQLQTLGQEAKKQRTETAEQTKKIERMSGDQTQLRLKISRLQSQLYQNQSEQNYLHLSGFTAVKAVLENRSRFGKVYGLVAELAEVPEDYRLALEVAAAAHLSSVVVENEQVARLAIEFLRENRYGVATFLPLNKIQTRGTYGDSDMLLGESGVIGKAIDLVKFDPKFQNIFSLIFGATLVVDTLQTVERLGIGPAYATTLAGKRTRMVTLEGDIVEASGTMRGGFRNRKNAIGFSSKLLFNNEDHLSEMQATIALETNNLTDLEKQIELAKGKLMELHVLAQSSANQVAMVEKEHTQVAKESARLEQELALIKASPEEYGEQLKKLAHEKDQRLEELEKGKASVLKIETEMKYFNEEEERKKQRVFALQETMQKKQEEVNVILNARNDLNIQLAKLETKQEDLAQEVVNDMKVSLHSLVERMGANVGVQNFEPLQTLADTIQKLKYQLSLIGGIDEEVVKEYGETKERYDFLTHQLADLRKAATDLHAMISELDELMKKKRGNAFKKIRKEFGRYFKILFEGGAADLEEVYGPPPSSNEASDFADATEQNSNEKPAQGGPALGGDKVLTGIEVTANPPGKKVKYLNMLSGGERTLTSIALICAILYHNPSPFVVLDEVEAALDETNTLRFAKIMAELSPHSQFIIVTHNRVTMHAAHSLYGVVMGIDGISKLLSVKLEDVPQYENQEPVARPAVDRKVEIY